MAEVGAAAPARRRFVAGERLLSQGADALSDAELLAAILRTGADGTILEPRLMRP